MDPYGLPITETERAILLEFARRYPDSAMRRGGRSLRIRNWESLMPEAFGSAERQITLLEAMEALERAGILRLGWKGRKKGETLVWAELVDQEALFGVLELESPEHRERDLQRTAEELGEQAEHRPDPLSRTLYHFVAGHSDLVSPYLTGRDLADIEKLLRYPPEEMQGLPLRALSIRIYQDSKRLEALLPRLKKVQSLLSEHHTPPQGVGYGDVRGLFRPLWHRLPVRSFPELWISGGSVDLVFSGGARWHLAAAQAVALSPSLVEQLVRVSPSAPEDADGQASKDPQFHSRPPVSTHLDGPCGILTVENKETFYALGKSGLPFFAYVYTGGRPNSLVRRFLHFCKTQSLPLYHAGDLDPDGIAILGELFEHYGSRPFGMDGAVFDRYRDFARPLDEKLVQRLAYIPLAIGKEPGIAALMERIRSTGKGLEQEIIDYSRLPPSTPALPVSGCSPF